MPGEISWIELPAAGTAKARAFYGCLFGWGTSEFGGDYHVIDNGPAGAIAPREDGAAAGLDNYSSSASRAPDRPSSPVPLTMSERPGLSGCVR
jgi:predicted enzyme related to lactoylglutathione lyase